MGNELWAGVPLNREFQAIARRLDPTRPFADTDGLLSKEFVLSSDRDTLDLYFTMFDVFRIPLGRARQVRSGKGAEEARHLARDRQLQHIPASGSVRGISREHQAILDRRGAAATRTPRAAGRDSNLGQELRTTLPPLPQAEHRGHPQESVYFRPSLVAVPRLLDDVQRHRRFQLSAEVDPPGRGPPLHQ